jgi:hypothetical protein
MATDVQEWVNNPGNNFGWIIVANETVGKTVKRYSSRENSNPLNWPVLTITYTGAVPVMLNYFRGTENSKGMLLSWQTLAEYNNLGFDIQHSTDGLNFTSIGKLPGAGNNSGIKNYQFIHTVIDPGNHFYRLVQTDRDGKTSYSNIVNILTRLKHAAFVIYPNPVMDYFQVSGLKSLDNAAYQVFNASGMVITEGKLITNEINTAGLPKGFYMIKIKQATETGFGRFVKE